MTNPSVGGGSATNSKYKIIQIQHNRIKNPNWQEETSRLFTSVAEDLNSGRQRTNPASGQSRTWNWDNHIASTHVDHSATLPPLSSYTPGTHLRKEFMSVLSSKWWTDKQGARCTSQQTSKHLRSSLVFTEGSNNGPVLIQPQTAGDCNWREACLTRRVILRSFEGESDGKSYIHNRREISLIQNHYNYKAAVPNWLPIQGHVTKTRSCRISVPPALWTFHSDFALIFHFFLLIFSWWPHIFFGILIATKKA